MKRRRETPWRTALRFAVAAFVVLSGTTGIPGRADAQPPAVDWKRTDWAPTHPANGSQAQIASGEDWWYDNVTSRVSNVVDGYLCAGYSSFVNWSIDETSVGGCLLSHQTDDDCTDFEDPTNLKGAICGKMALIAPGGGSYLWYRRYNEGAFNRVIQTSDGGFLAIGNSASTRVIGTSAPTSTPLYYNPNQTGSLADQFDLGTASTATDYIRHVILVKVDHSGNVEWQYLYGIVPYRVGSQAQSSAAYHANGEGWDVEELPGHAYAFVGQAWDPALGIARAFIIKVDSLGRWLWGNYYGPADRSSVGKAITSTVPGRT